MSGAMLSLVRQALELADEYVIADIESGGVRVGPPQDRRWDVSAMFSPHEHAGVVIDMAEKAIAYAVARGLVQIEPERHTVRILRALPS
jgi:hypothetical protein